MSKNQYRIAVVGATTLLGKEIGDEIAESPLAAATAILLDTEEESGTLEAMGDEASFVQPLETAAFENLDVAIFSDAAMLREYGTTAQQMGVAVVDAAASIQDSGIAPVRSPLLRDGAPLGLEDAYVRCAHPAATMLAAVLSALDKSAAIRSVAATVLQPASENGRAGVDEMQQQAVNLLSFQPVPRDQFDAQVAFNLLPALGESARNALDAVGRRIQADLHTITGGRLPVPVLQVVQAPVFHGFTVSLFVDFAEPLPPEVLAVGLQSDLLDLVSEEGDPPSNLSSAGQGQVLLQITAVQGKGAALWLAADNLKLRARTAVACALELTRLRPLGKVQ